MDKVSGFIPGSTIPIFFSLFVFTCALNDSLSLFVNATSPEAETAIEAATTGFPQLNPVPTRPPTASAKTVHTIFLKNFQKPLVS